MASEVVVDTSALVEYVDGTRKGMLVKEVIENQENIVFIPSIVLGEFVSKLERKGFSNTQEIINNLREYTIFVDSKASHCIKAGKKHARLRKIEKDISLIDCIVMEIAEEHKALILTNDSHFKHYKNAKLL